MVDGLVKVKRLVDLVRGVGRSGLMIFGNRATRRAAVWISHLQINAIDKCLANEQGGEGLPRVHISLQKIESSIGVQTCYYKTL
jgi:hypothetical protein